MQKHLQTLKRKKNINGGAVPTVILNHLGQPYYYVLLLIVAANSTDDVTSLVERQYEFVIV